MTREATDIYINSTYKTMQKGHLNILVSDSYQEAIKLKPVTILKQVDVRKFKILKCPNKKLLNKIIVI